jgi:hypothetical protein
MAIFIGGYFLSGHNIYPCSANGTLFSRVAMLTLKAVIYYIVSNNVDFSRAELIASIDARCMHMLTFAATGFFTPKFDRGGGKITP